MIFKLRSKIWQSTLEALAERNAPVTISSLWADSDDQTPPTFHVRLLSFSKEAVIVDRPGAKEFAPGEAICLFAIDDTQRWECRCNVIESMRFDLNAEVTVNALKLSFPRRVRKSQRRRFYRVSTAAEDIPPIYLTAITPEHAWQRIAAIGSELSFSATLLDISGGGIKIHAPAEAAAVTTQFRNYRCLLNLPLIKQVMEIAVRVAHVATQDDGSLHIGMNFEFEDAEQAYWMTDQICRYVVALERKQLRRRHNLAS